MEVWLSPALGFDYVHGKIRLYGTGSRPISWVSYRDVAEFCIAPVLRSLASRSVLAVGGPEALTPLEVVRIFEEESGRHFEVETIPEEKLRAISRQRSNTPSCRENLGSPTWIRTCIHA